MEKEQIKPSIETSGVETPISPAVEDFPVESISTPSQEGFSTETLDRDPSQDIIVEEAIDNTSRSSRKVPISDPKRASTWSSLLKKTRGVPPSSL